MNGSKRRPEPDPYVLYHRLGEILRRRTSARGRAQIGLSSLEIDLLMRALKAAEEATYLRSALEEFYAREGRARQIWREKGAKGWREALRAWGTIGERKTRGPKYDWRRVVCFYAALLETKFGVAHAKGEVADDGYPEWWYTFEAAAEDPRLPHTIPRLNLPAIDLLRPTAGRYEAVKTPVDPAEAVRVTKEVFGFPTLRSCRDYLKQKRRRAKRERERLSARVAELGLENAFWEHQLLEALPADFALPSPKELEP